MSTLKSSAENLTLNADGSGNDIILQSNGSTKAIVTAEGSLGVGVTPETTHSTWTALQVGGTGNILGETSQAASQQVCLGQNVYMDAGGDFTYIVADEASYYRQYSGTHAFFVAASGSADATISPTTGVEVLADGKARAKNGLLFGTDTAAANTLDDYEEGSWTPTYAPETGSFTTLTLVGATPGRYVKIGKQVTCWWYLGTAATNLTGASGDLYVSGLPFANETVGAGNWSTGIYSTKWGGDQPTIASIHSSESFIRLLYRASHNADLSAQQTTDMDTGGDSNYTRGWVTYNTA